MTQLFIYVNIKYIIHYSFRILVGMPLRITIPAVEAAAEVGLRREICMFFGVTVFKSSVFKFVDSVTRSTTLTGSAQGVSGGLGGAAASWWWRFVMRDLRSVVSFEL